MAADGEQGDVVVGVAGGDPGEQLVAELVEVHFHELAEDVGALSNARVQTATVALRTHFRTTGSCR
jgi:hypothetical protein